MQSSASIGIETPRTTGDDHAYIGVAVVWFPETFNLVSATILRNALEAGLLRKGVRIESHGGYFKNVFSVSLFQVSPSDKGSALAAIRETLSELQLLELATIAVRTAEQIWHTIHGLGIGGMTFGRAFLQEADITAAREQAKSSTEQTAVSFQALLEEWKRTHPEAPGDTDLK